MGNRLSKRISTQQQTLQQSQQQNLLHSRRQSPRQISTPQLIWQQSAKNIQDLKTFLHSSQPSQWSVAIRPFLKQFRIKQQYQTYIRVILEYLLLQTEKQPTLTSQLCEIFDHYKRKLQLSYFVEGQFSENLLSSIQAAPFQERLYFLYEYKTITTEYIEECFIEMFPEILLHMDRFAQNIIENNILVQDQLQLMKFIVTQKAINEGCEYVEMCSKILLQQQRTKLYVKIKAIKQNPQQMYIKMCQVFLKYKNGQIAELILRTLIQKGYKLLDKQIQLYFYVEVYNLFMYKINRFPHLNRLPAQPSQSQKNFQSFEYFNSLNKTEILHMFFITKPYRQIHLLRRCFQVYHTHGQEIQKFILVLKQYVFSQICNFMLTLQAMNSDLNVLPNDQKKALQNKFLQKFLKCKFQIAKNSQFILQTAQQYYFSQQVTQIIKTLLKSGHLFNIFGTNLQFYQLSFFLPQKYQNHIPGHFRKKSPSQLQYLCIVSLKNIIGKYFVLDKTKSFKFQQQTYQIKNIQTLFTICQWLKQNLYHQYISLTQIHQIIFQHMLFFYKYEEVRQMLTEKMKNKYKIQYELIKMIIIENIDEMLKKDAPNVSGNSIAQITGDIKLQFRILNDHSVGDYKQTEQQLQPIKALFQLIKKLDSYSIKLSKEQKQNISIDLLYWLMRNYDEKIEVLQWDEMYRLISIIKGKDLVSQELGSQQSSLVNKSGAHVKSSKHSTFSPLLVTNEYLKFKIDLANMAYQNGKPKFGQQTLKQVLAYEPPWISTQIIKIIQTAQQASPSHSINDKSSIVPASINENFLNIAFQYCLKGQDLLYLLNIWKKKKKLRGNKSTLSNKQNKHLVMELFESTQKFIVIDDTYINDQKEYRNLVGEMTFNDQVLKGKEYEMFFVLLGTEPERAFYMVFSNKLDVFKIEAFLKQGMKLNVLNTVNVTKTFFKLLYFMSLSEKDKQKVTSLNPSFKKFKALQMDEIISNLQKENYLIQQINKNLKSISLMMIKRMYKSVKSLLILPYQFIENYIQNSSVVGDQQYQSSQILYMFLYDQNYRQKHLINLKDQAMGKNDINLYKQLCSINGFNIIQLILFNMANYLNTVSQNEKIIQEEQNLQNMLQKLVTWSENNIQLCYEILGKLISKIFSSLMLYEVLNYLKHKQNLLFQKLISEQHMQIIQGLKSIQINTQFHGILPQSFFSKPLAPHPKQNLSEKHIKLLKRQLKLHNVFVISKILYFCYGMSNEVQKQVLKIFLKENEGKEQQKEKKEQFLQLKRKLYNQGNH